jgi:hypothetical protein
MYFLHLTRNEDDFSERPLHLFFQCRHTEPVVLGVYNWFLNNKADFDNMSRRNFFYNFQARKQCKNQTVNFGGNFCKNIKGSASCGS